ncbi:MAG: methyltransferase domain-containing protein [Burkholderiales bacterium]|nr:methyltransferase domain-containing protein [Burkholderiales bacterium]
MTAPSPDWLDRAAARRALNRAARGKSATDPLAAEIGKRMAERLDYIRIAPRRSLEVLHGASPEVGELRRRYPGAERYAIEPVHAGAGTQPRWTMRLVRSSARFLGRSGVRVVCANGAMLPFAASCFSLVWSNLALAAHDDPAAVLREWRRVLAAGGLLMFSTLGPDTLKELRAAFVPDPFPHVHPFVDMHDVGDMLVAAGFAEPVIDMEMLTLTYAGIEGLLEDLRRAGATNAHVARRRGLTGRGIWERARAAYAGQQRDGRLPASIEVVYGHAWKPATRNAADGRQIIQFDAKLRRRKPG